MLSDISVFPEIESWLFSKDTDYAKKTHNSFFKTRNDTGLKLQIKFYKNQLARIKLINGYMNIKL